MAQQSSRVGDILLRVLVCFLFICIGIEGIGNFGGNALYRAFDSRAFSIILGTIILVAGVLVLLPIFYSKFPKVFTTSSMIAIFVVWILVIIFSDFVYGLNNTSGKDWFVWIENFIYHLLILGCVYKVSSEAILSVVNKKK